MGPAAALLPLRPSLLALFGAQFSRARRAHGAQAILVVSLSSGSFVSVKMVRDSVGAFNAGRAQIIVYAQKQHGCSQPRLPSS